MEFGRRGVAASQPIDQIDVAFIEQPFVGYELGSCHLDQISLGEGAEQQVGLLGAAIAALIEQPLALLGDRVIGVVGIGHKVRESVIARPEFDGSVNHAITETPARRRDMI